MGGRPVKSQHFRLYTHILFSLKNEKVVFAIYLRTTAKHQFCLSLKPDLSSRVNHDFSLFTALQLL